MLLRPVNDTAVILIRPQLHPLMIGAIPFIAAMFKEGDNVCFDIQVQTKRGCALNCAYCTYNCIEGKRWRLRDPEAVAGEIEEIVS